MTTDNKNLSPTLPRVPKETKVRIKKLVWIDGGQISWAEIDFKDLKKNDVFRAYSPNGKPFGGILMADEDSEVIPSTENLKYGVKCKQILQEDL